MEEARRTLVPSERVDRLQMVMRRIMDEQLFVPLLSERTVTFLPPRPHLEAPRGRPAPVRGDEAGRLDLEPGY
jgi:hypothetical protein